MGLDPTQPTTDASGVHLCSPRSSKQGGQTYSKPDRSAAINLFAGLIVYNLFAECISKAPTLVLSQPNYVTKVIFPLELLSAVAVSAAAFHLAPVLWF